MIGKIIKFNDKEYLLRYGFKAQAKLKEVFDGDFDLETLAFTDCPKVIWALMTDKISLVEVEEMLEESDYGLNEIITLMSKTIVLGRTGKEVSVKKEKSEETETEKNA